MGVSARVLKEDRRVELLPSLITGACRVLSDADDPRPRHPAFLQSRTARRSPKWRGVIRTAGGLDVLLYCCTDVLTISAVRAVICCISAVRLHTHGHTTPVPVQHIFDVLMYCSTAVHQYSQGSGSAADRHLWPGLARSQDSFRLLHAWLRGNRDYETANCHPLVRLTYVYEVCGFWWSWTVPGSKEKRF